MDRHKDRTKGHAVVGLKWLVPLALTLTAIFPPVFAQSPPTSDIRPPTPAEPVTKPPTKPVVPPASLPDISIESLQGAAPPGAEHVRMILRTLEIEGVTVYADEEIKVIYGELLGTEISVQRLFQIAESIQEKYRSAGYLLTRVIVPAQTAKNGVFRLQVIEGFISKVTVEGDIGSVLRRAQAYLDKVTREQPVNIQHIERYLLIVADIPGVTAAGVLRPDKEKFGAAELVVKVTRKPYEGSVFANNRGSKYTGPKRAAISVQENAATAFGERAEVFLFISEDNEQKYGQLAYEQLMGDEGMKFGVSAAVGPSEPGHTLEALNLETESQSARVFFSYPVIRSRSENLYIRGGFDAMRSTVEFANTITSRDRLRVVYVDASYEFKDRFGGQSLVGLGLRQGLEILGASKSGDANLSRSEGRSDATTLQARGQRYQQLTDKLGLFIAANAQYALNPLLADEEFSVGGESFGRGYDPAELKGDHGIGFTVEARYSKRMESEYLDGYQGYGFYDFGSVWNKDSGQGRDSLASAGLGARIQIKDIFFLDVELAKPLTKTPATENDRDPRFFVQFLTHF